MHTKLIGFSHPEAALFEPKASSVDLPKLPESGFLLDWLSGGDVFHRNIQGFPLGFEIP